MKTILSLPAFALLSLISYKSHPFYSIIKNDTGDSTIINHVLDGSIKEWPSGLFKTDNETGIQYAIDNDAKNIFMAMSIPNFRTQLKMMHEGMSMYIDLKGKKKEGRGIEFPVKNGSPDANDQSFSGARTNRQNNDQPTTEQQRRSDIKAMRKMMALNLVEMKVFGFSDDAPDDQQLLLPGSANIAFAWDSADNMHIEYLIPLSMFGDLSSLDKKDISIGWKIHAVEIPKPTEGSESTSTESRPSGGRGDGGYGGGGGGRRSGGGGYGGAGSSRYSEGDREKMMGEQKFWTKYMINIPPAKKAF
jgi:uncharacterized membrane protein YgcG